MRIEILEHERLVHEMRIPIRRKDKEVMGHLDDISRFRDPKTARIAWSNGGGVQAAPACEGFVIVERSWP